MAVGNEEEDDDGMVYVTKKRAKYSEYEVSKYDDDVDTDEEGVLSDRGADPGMMNPAKVPNLVGASSSASTTGEWHRTRRRSSIELEERMWEACENRSTAQHAPPSSSVRHSPSASSPLCTILEDSPLSARQLHYGSNTHRGSCSELKGARSFNELYRSDTHCRIPQRYERRRREQSYGRRPPRYGRNLSAVAERKPVGAAA
ncbi:hypothetical protein FOL47_009643 [Perkinsus chesapeaki]|uniref:Uncharacterized protein n=1 Tax=Perkinsus chesapeaki TaxID=330153 RepID=A0A7J6L707_PERCH|nr:hypothetical protein FOL47_009643 [Perkinsus chesapeaki]